jgi:hypothetical protein
MQQFLIVRTNNENETQIRVRTNYKHEQPIKMKQSLKVRAIKNI